MKFVFDYEETLTRRVVIDANCLSDALHEIERRIEDEEIVLGSEDFVGGLLLRRDFGLDGTFLRGERKNGSNRMSTGYQRITAKEFLEGCLSSVSSKQPEAK